MEMINEKCSCGTDGCTCKGGCKKKCFSRWRILLGVLLLLALFFAGMKIGGKRAMHHLGHDRGTNSAVVAEKNGVKADAAEGPKVDMHGDEGEGGHGPVEEQVLEIADGVYSYTLGGLYSMFVVTDEGVIAIESANTKHATGLLAAIKSVTDKPVKYMLHSHNHWDHASGGQVFIDAGATTLAHIQAYEWMEANPGKDMALPTETWDGARKDITLGGVTVELHFLGMNHGLGMTVFVLPETKTAYIADLVTPNRVLMSTVPDFNIKEWERSLEEIIELDFDRAIYSHNEYENAIEGGTKKDVVDTLQFIRDLRGAIFAEFQKGTNAMMVPDVVELPQYKDWAMYDQWLPMNAWRIILDEFMGPYPWIKPDNGGKNSMSAIEKQSEETMNIATGFMGAMGEGDMEKMISLMDDDMVWHNEGDKTIPWIGDWKGKTTILEEFLPLFGTGLETTLWETEDSFANGDTAVFFGKMNGNVKTTGAEIGEFTFALRVKVKDGKIILWNWLEDSYALSKAYNAK